MDEPKHDWARPKPFTIEDLDRLQGKRTKPAPSPAKPRCPTGEEELLRGIHEGDIRGRWRDSNDEWREAVAAAHELKYGFTEIPFATFDTEPDSEEAAWAPIKAELQAKGTAMLRRLEATREELERKQRSAAIMETLRRRRAGKR